MKNPLSSIIYFSLIVSSIIKVQGTCRVSSPIVSCSSSSNGQSCAPLGCCAKYDFSSETQSSSSSNCVSCSVPYVNYGFHSCTSDSNGNTCTSCCQYQYTPSFLYNGVTLSAQNISVCFDNALDCCSSVGMSLNS